MAKKRDLLKGKKIDPKPIHPSTSIAELVDNNFLAYNGGRLTSPDPGAAPNLQHAGLGRKADVGQVGVEHLALLGIRRSLLEVHSQVSHGGGIGVADCRVDVR